MLETPRANRLHIAIFGRRNVGKSSLINALTNQEAALVSATPGTTTDPVYKSMEILPIGPVVIIDTAGLDDVGELGELRVKRTLEVLARTDLAVLVIDAASGAGDFDRKLMATLRERKVPVVCAANKADMVDTAAGWSAELGERVVPVSARTGAGIAALKEAIIQATPERFGEEMIIGDLVSPGDVAVLVAPIDMAAPKGRLILPQVQTLRDLLDHDAVGLVVKEDRLKEALSRLKRPPKIVVTDSQAFHTVAADTPADVWLTSFSILFARLKGDLVSLTESAGAIDALRPGDKVLIAEGCTHHRQEGDIGKAQIPRFLRQMVGGDLDLAWTSGNGFPEDLRPFKLVVHCGACMINRREMLSRLARARAQAVPVVNYGILLARVHGVLPRALEPFPAARLAWERSHGTIVSAVTPIGTV